MATALHSSRNDAGPNIHPAMYTGLPVMTELDFQDERYPSPIPHSNAQRTSALIYGANERSGWDDISNNADSAARRMYDPNGAIYDVAGSRRAPEQTGNQDSQQPQFRISATSADMQSLKSQSQSQSQSQSLEPQRNTLSYALPAGTARRVVERYSLEDNEQRAPSRTSANSKPVAMPPEPSSAPLQSPMGRSSPLPVSAQRPTPPNVVAPRGSNDYPIMPLAASPSYNPPVAPKHRAYAQQPTYITPPTTPTPVKTVYAQQHPPPREEVCVECAMRDEEMADVDVTSPGVWERESDAAFEELKRREEEDQANGIVRPDDSKKPKTRGGRLTEQNLKLWQSINPREPTARQQTLKTYIKSQRMLLDAEAVARSRARHEAKRLDNQMRDTYSQLRRSAYDLGNASSPADNTGGVRIKPPLSPTSPVHNSHARSHSREVTLLENGMIVEHVDVRKEEREARERKKKEERRARKSSRGSIMDVTSIISANSLGVAQTDGGYGLRPNSPYAAAYARPTSAFTVPIDRAELPGAYSQASFSDVHSMGSASPRRTTRFFGFKNLSAGWRSQDSLAAASGIQSGSMIDMHLALQREGQRSHPHGMSPPSARSDVRSQFWPPGHTERQTDIVAKKKKKGLAKFWGMVTGANKQSSAVHHDSSQSLGILEKQEDNLPLAPPPPLSFLVDRSSHELRAANGRHGSTPSLPSLTSPKMNTSATPGMSPSTGSSSIFSFPASSRTSGPDVDIADARKTSANYDDLDSQFRDDTICKGQLAASKNVHPVTSEPDISQLRARNMSSPPPIPIAANPNSSPSLRPPSTIFREKSLPPLPTEAGTRQSNINSMELRPQTLYTYDPRQLPPGSAPAHDFLPTSAPYRTADVRRQSFGGLATRPNLVVQTMPVNGRSYASPAFGPGYDEFGYSRRSLGPLEFLKDATPVRQTPTPKWKHKLGFASLLRKKSASREPVHSDQNLHQHHQFPLMHQTELDGPDDVRMSAYTTSVSKHSALSAHGPPTRLSVASRKALEERVSQDPEFVAYRYPSNDQHLEFLR